jgi:hypothetical protein
MNLDSSIPSLGDQDPTFCGPILEVAGFLGLEEVNHRIPVRERFENWDERGFAGSNGKCQWDAVCFGQIM